MLKRLYVHNYKCLVNLDINIDKNFGLFMGENGSGKTAVFDALYEIQHFIRSGARLDDKLNTSFKSSTLTRWLNEPVQKFELDINGNSGLFKYTLEIEHNLERKLIRVKSEALLFNNQPLYKFSIEEQDGMSISVGRLFNDHQTSNEGIPWASSWFSSALGSIQERHDNKKLSWFKKWLDQLYIIKITPSTLKIEIDTEEAYPERNLSNYAAWLNYWNNENSEGVFLVLTELKKIIKEFKSFKFTQLGLQKILEVKIDKLFYFFNELSDGQQALTILYTIIYCVPENSFICIDEPENFVALPEIQPWFDKLYDQCAERGLQALLISHHPNIINYLASDSGYWFSRENNLTRIQKISAENESGLSVAELVELGWIYDE
ncbi:MAG: AAA family ATPase [Methylococcaceae bacterium]|nr:AAA family ATPase [Methylococcaceae bacterium]